MPALAIVALALAVGAVHAAPTLPADRFMHAVVTRDGALGWQQLCPAVQSQLPQADLVSETDAVRAKDVASGTTLEVQFAAAQPRPDGGESRAYLVTARRADGQVNQTTFVVSTQPSGCVESVE